MVKQWVVSVAISVVLILIFLGVFIWSPIAFIVIGCITMVIDVVFSIKDALFPKD